MKLPAQLVKLGEAVELDSSGWIWTWNAKDRARLYSSTSGKMLFIILDRMFTGRRVPVRSGAQDFSSAKKLYKRFQDFESERVHKVRAKTKALKACGDALHIKYLSDKWGDKNQGYIHKFKKGVKIWVDSPSKPAIIGIMGRTLKVTARGIEG